MTLLAEIQQAAINSGVELSDLLRRCKILAARLKHKEFADWVNHELNGYADEEPLPAYRRLLVHSLGDFSGPFGSGIKNARIPVLNLPEPLRHHADEQVITEPVSALAAHLNDARVHSMALVQAKWPADVVAFVARHHPMYQNMRLLDAWRVIPVAAISGILDTVRTRILDFVLAVEAEAPAAGEVPPGGRPPIANERITYIYNTTIHGGHANILHQPGEVAMSTKYSSHVSGSNVGAVAVGETATAHGNIGFGNAPLTQEQHRTALKETQAALLQDQDKLDAIDQRLYEALGQFLRLARDIQVEQQSLATVQAKMKETLDEVWAQQAAKGLRPQLLPKTLELAEALLKNPAMTEVVKVLIAS